MVEQPTTGWTPDQVKQLVESKIADVQRAVDVALEGEPPHVALQYHFEKVFDLTERATQRAEREREKAAEALRIELARAIEEGDRNLRDHIEAQVSQIQSALLSADELEQERMSRIAERIDAERRVAELTRELSDTAILKAEDAARKQFDEFSKAVTLQLDAMRVTMQDLTRRMDKTLS